MEQDNALAVAAEKYKKSRNEITKMKKENEEQVNKLKQEIARSLYRVIFFWEGGGGGAMERSRDVGRSDFRYVLELFIFC